MASDPKDRDLQAEFEQALRSGDHSHYMLRLYITGMSPRSVAALENLRAICDQYLENRYELEVVDLLQEPGRAGEANLVAAPTLIKELPLPVRRLLGDLSNTEKVLLGLDLGEAEQLMFSAKVAALEAELATVRAELAEAREALDAIRTGQVDALVVMPGTGAERVFTLEGTDFAYRALVEQMHEGAATISASGHILYSNQGLADLFKRPLGAVIGALFQSFFMPPDDAWIQERQAECLANSQACKTEALLAGPDGMPTPVTLSLNAFNAYGTRTLSVTVTDLTEHLALARAKARRESEEALRASEKRYRDLVSLSPEPIAVQADGRWLFLNQAALALFGAAAPEAILGRSILDLVEPEDRTAVKTRIQALTLDRKSQGPPLQIRMHRLDGTPIEVEGSGITIDFNGQPAILLMLRDITERKRAEEALRASETRFRSLFESINEGIALCEILCDASGVPCDYRHLDVNPGYLRQTGLTREQVIGRTVKEMLPGVEPIWIERYGQVALTGEPTHLEAFAGPLGRFFEVNAYQAAPGQFITLFQDVTNRHLAAERLRESQERYRLLAETMLQGVVHQDAEGSIIAMNPAAERILGKSREDFLGNTSESVEHDTVREDGSVFPGMEHPAMVALRTGTPVRDVVMGVYNPREQVRRWIRIDAVPLFRPDTIQPFQVYTVFDDITARKLAEERLHASEAALRVSIQNLQTVMETAPVAICVTHDRQCQDIVGNAQASLVLGMPIGENISLTPANKQAIPYQVCRNGELVVGPDLPMQRAARTGESTTEEEYEIIRQNGSRIVILMSANPLHDDAGAITGAVGTFLDISERKQAEMLLEQRVAERTAELDRANRTLQMIMECNQVLVRVQDEADLMRQICGIIRRLGGYCLAWVGLAERDEARTVRPIAWDGEGGDYLARAQITWADEPRGQGPTGSCLRLREVRLNRDFQTEPAVAPWRDIALRHGFRSSLALPLIWEDQVFGALTIYSERPDAFDADQIASLNELAEDLAFGIAAIRSRTERDQARQTAEQRAEMLRKLATELIQTEKRERQKLAQILHDHLQQLLLAAKLRLDSLLGNAQDDGTRTACGSVADLLVQAIQSSRSLAFELSPPVLQEKGLMAAVEWLSRQMQDRYGLRVEVLADERHYALTPQLFTFLFDAIRELLFNVTKHAGVDHAEVRLAEVDGWIEVDVRDEGAGFDPQRIADGRGIGFGLFSLRERLEYLNGRLQVQSTPGKGTCFRIIVPFGALPPTVSAGQADPAEVLAQPGEQRAELRRIRILLADNHPTLRQNLALLLGNQPDLEIIGEAGDGEEALALAHQLRPDVILMDMSMPRLNGIEATRLISRDLPDTAVIGLSMYDDPERAQALRSAGALEFRSKSGAVQELIAAIRSVHRRNQPRDQGD